jgi:methylthioribose-1-phosphate isomerase
MRLTDDALELLDQRLLPGEETLLNLTSGEQVAQAIEQMAVRGAPAIGVTAAFGVVVELRRVLKAGADLAALRAACDAVCLRLRATRPTAVNLAWALDKARRALDPLFASDTDPAGLVEAAEKWALRLQEDDVRICRAIGDAGSPLLPNKARVLTHCNAGALATAGYGTALGVVRSAARDGRLAGVLACETRPFLQGARLTAWELARDAIPVKLITDSMAGSLMRLGEIDLVVIGADRIAANGDVANKIGSYALAVLARAHGLPFYVAAPLSTVDLATPDGSAIPIEQRDPDEVVCMAGQRIAPAGVSALHPAFDVTPAELVTAIITERGVIEAPFGPGLAAAKRG